MEEWGREERDCKRLSVRSNFRINSDIFFSASSRSFKVEGGRELGEGRGEEEVGEG
jgi:hypothetical protein